MLIAQGRTAYTLVMERLPQGNLQDVPIEHLVLEEPKPIRNTLYSTTAHMIYQISMVRIQDILHRSARLSSE